jgi:hypothetical protein
MDVIHCVNEYDEKEKKMKKTLTFIQPKLGITMMAVLILAVACSTGQTPISVNSGTKQAEIIKPGEPGAPIKVLEDANSSLKASEKRAVSGDNFSDGLYERPFTSQSMIYQPDLDILNASMSKDDKFFYFVIKLAGVIEKPQPLSGQYGIEFDLNKDGRGDLLVLAQKPVKEWSTAGVQIFTDPDGDVGGKIPMTTEAGFKGDGYEKKMDASNSGAAVFARLSPSDPASVEIAVSADQLGGVKEYLWNAWADGGIQDPSKFDYNDTFGPSQAGSPIKTAADYPLKALFSLDNTCRVVYGFTSNINIPGMCTSVQPKEPAATRGPAGAIFN